MRISDWSSDVCSSDLPAELLSSGYGLPQRAEREALAAQAAQRAQRLREQGQRLHRDARSLLPRRQREALDAIEANIALLGSRLRQLHRESGGLDLDRLSDLPSVGVASRRLFAARSGSAAAAAPPDRRTLPDLAPVNRPPRPPHQHPH